MLDSRPQPFRVISQRLDFINTCVFPVLRIFSKHKTFEVDADRERAFGRELEDGKEALHRLELVKELQDNLSHDWKIQLEASAFNVLSCLLNLVGENVSYYATCGGGGRVLSKTGKSDRNSD